MSLSRRRFLTIAAAFAATPASATPHRWKGRALGAYVEITIHGPAEWAEAALSNTRIILTEIERLFSLYDPNSALSRLNRHGSAHALAQNFAHLLAEVHTVHKATNGLFDPTVQPLWRALAEGRAAKPVLPLVGWEKVRLENGSIRLAPGQSLTLNGIAQGFATDRVADAFAAEGLTNTLINIGEFRGTGGPWHLGLVDPAFGTLGRRTIAEGAIATSSPQALPLAGNGHIIHPTAKPIWSTVSVEAETATMADGFSTALTMADLPMIRDLIGRYGLRRVTLVDAEGDLITL